MIRVSSSLVYPNSTVVSAVLLSERPDSVHIQFRATVETLLGKCTFISENFGAESNMTFQIFSENQVVE